jgi:hypothetical protein
MFKKNTFLFNIFFLILFSNLFFGWGFQILNIASIPINYIVLIFFLLILPLRENIIKLSIIGFTSIFSIFILFNSVKLIFSISNYGIISIRDASFFIDSLFILISFSFFSQSDNLHKIKKIFDIFFVALIFYIFVWMYEDFFLKFSPIVTSPTGNQTNIFFNFSTLAFLSMWFSFYKIIIKEDKNNNFFNNVIFIFLILFSIIIFQRRFIYIAIICIFIASIILNKTLSIRYFSYFLLGFLFISTFSFFGISFEGKLSRVTNIMFFIDHLGSAIPGYKYENEIFDTTRGTVQTRMFFWQELIRNLTSTPYNLFFGKSFGLPLVNFIGQGGIVIREPHNMYLSIFGRGGLIGLFIYIILNIKLINIFFKSYTQSKSDKNSLFFKIILFIGIYILSMYNMGISDSILTNSYFSITLNILWGLVLAIYYNQNYNEKKYKKI